MLSLVALLAQLAATAIGMAAIGRLTRTRPVPPWATALLGLGVAALAIVTCFLSDPPTLFDDFTKAYYPAGHAVVADPAALRALTDKGVTGFVNLPVTAYLFAPFAALPLLAGAGLFTALGVAFTAAAWALLAKLGRLDVADRWRLALLFAANGPLAYSLREGNTSHVILFALAAGLVLIRAGRPGAAGGVLACAALIKPPLILFGVFFLLRRDWRGGVAFGGVLAAVAALSLARFGWTDNLHWFDVCILQFSHCWLSAFNVQSIAGFLFRLTGGPGLLTDWHAYPPPAGLQLPATLSVLLMLGVALLAALPASLRPEDTARRERRRDLQYLLVLMLTLVASPLTWSHYYVWLLVPAALFLGERRDWSARERLAGWSAVWLVTPLARFLPLHGAAAIFVYKNIAVSHFLFGGLVWFGLTAWRLARSDGLIVAWIRGRSRAHRTAQMTWRRPGSAGTVPETPLS